MNPGNLHKELLDIIRISKKSKIVLGSILADLKANDNFKDAVGMGADTWPDYLRQPEIALSPHEASAMIKLYEELCVRLGYDVATASEIPNKNLQYLLPLIKNLEPGDEVDELIADATLLSQKDFKEKLWDKRKGTSGVRRFEYFIMRKTLDTNTLDRVHDIDSDTLISDYNLAKSE